MKKFVLTLILALSVSGGCAPEKTADVGDSPAPPDIVLAPEPAPEPVVLNHAVDPSTLALMIDPVCKMSFEEYAVETTTEHAGKQYGFCSDFCKRKFAEDPDKLLERLTETTSTP